MKKPIQIATVFLTTLTISLGSNAVAFANPAPQSPVSTASDSPVTDMESLKASVEGVTPAAVIDRTVEEDENMLTEITTLDTGDVFTSILDKLKCPGFCS